MESLILLLAMCGQVKLDGPAAANVNEKVLVEVTGLPSFDITKPIGESLAWTETMKFVVSAPDDKTRLDSVIGLDFLSKQWRLTLSFQPKVPGTYIIIVGPDIITHRVQVGGSVPPNPPDPPTPPVVVGGKRTVMLIREASDQSPAWAKLQVVVRNGQTADWLKMRGHLLLILDKDATDMGPYQEVLKAEAAKGIPRIVVMDQTNTRVLLSDSFDAGNPDTIIELIKRTGG